MWDKLLELRLSVHWPDITTTIDTFQRTCESGGKKGHDAQRNSRTSLQHRTYSSTREHERHLPREGQFRSSCKRNYCHKPFSPKTGSRKLLICRHFSKLVWHFNGTQFTHHENTWCSSSYRHVIVHIYTGYVRAYVAISTFYMIWSLFVCLPPDEVLPLQNETSKPFWINFLSVEFSRITTRLPIMNIPPRFTNVTIIQQVINSVQFL